MVASSSVSCLNCGATLAGPYCARCGQKAAHNDLTLGGFLHETTHELTHWDGKIPSTLKTLFLKPGQLTLDFLSGRRARWLAPLRVYLICSLAFFGGRVLLEEIGLHTTREMVGMSLTNDDGTPVRTLTAEEREQLENGPLGRIFGAERLERAVLDSKDVNRKFDAAIPRAMFVLLPIFALLTNLAWRKARPGYPAHLYAALHIHSVIFGALLVFSIVAGMIGSAAIGTILFLLFVGYIVWYCLSAFRLVFRDTWPKTIVKSAVVGGVYLACLALVGFGFLAYTMLRM